MHLDTILGEECTVPVKVLSDYSVETTFCLLRLNSKISLFLALATDT